MNTNMSVAYDPDALRRAIRAFVAVRGLTVRGWAKRAGVGSALQNFLDGASQSLRTATQKRLVAAEPDSRTLFASALAAGEPSHSEVAVHLGLDRNGMIIELIERGGSARTVPAPERYDPTSVEPIDMGEFEFEPFGPGWLAWVSTTERLPGELLNTVCLVTLADGSRAMRRLLPGTKPGLYTLFTPYRPPVLDQRVVSARKIEGFDQP